MAAGKETPLMKQYAQIKAKYPDALLLFRVGDFYETFGPDAERASAILNITLTKRANGAASEVALAGFPHHALDNYLPKLVKSGARVAVCDQLEDPKTAVGIVKRGVTELVTPGISMHDQVLDAKRNNFLAALHINGEKAGVAFLDISTGEFMATQGSKTEIDKLLQSYQPQEVVLNRHLKKSFVDEFGDDFNLFGLDEWLFQYDFGAEQLTRHFQTKNLKGFGVEDMPEAVIAAGIIIYYLHETEHKDLGHINTLSRIDQHGYVWLDKFTIRNLELVQAQQEKGKPLIEVIDETVTPMGARLLRQWLLLPLREIEAINQRLSVVKALLADPEITAELRKYLKQIGDLERLVSKVSTARVSPREMVSLRRALQAQKPLKARLYSSGLDSLMHLSDQLNPCEALVETLEQTLNEDAPISISQGNFIKPGVDANLDELRDISQNGKGKLQQIQDSESSRTGIPSLKINYNKVFGYYLEVTNTHKDKVPTDWIRKQTLVNAERYITPELKTFEEQILTAEMKISAIETDLFNRLVKSALAYLIQIQQNAKILARLDCLCGFAVLAEKRNYHCPTVNDSLRIDIKEGRHPVIETQLPDSESYIPNDVLVDNESEQIMIITGPNMAGKSALLRQTALICLMAQIGSYVPAKSADIGLVDKIFTRVGASDNLSKGESTFMVEMNETASILNNLSNRSLVLMDEIGRGTSTYDGVSIAWAIVEFLHQHPKFKARTMFATHYHELNELATKHNRVKNFNVSVKETADKVIFLRKLEPGGSEHSFGIHVAQMAGMPNSVVIRAAEIMRELEKHAPAINQKQKIKEAARNTYQLSFFESANPALAEIEKQLRQIDINNISPVEALLKLHELKKMAN